MRRPLGRRTWRSRCDAAIALAIRVSVSSSESTMSKAYTVCRALRSSANVVSACASRARLYTKWDAPVASRRTLKRLHSALFKCEKHHLGHARASPRARRSRFSATVKHLSRNQPLVTRHLTCCKRLPKRRLFARSPIGLQSNPRSRAARRPQIRLKMGRRRAAVSVAVFGRFAIYANVVGLTCQRCVA